MATVLEDSTNEEQRYVVSSFGRQKDSMQRIFINKCFLFMVGSVCRVKWFTTGWQTFRWWRRGWKEGGEIAEARVKRLLFRGVRRTCKAMGQVYQCSWRMCRKMNIFPRFKLHMVYLLYPFVTYLFTLRRILVAFRAVPKTHYNHFVRLCVRVKQVGK
jgi:hypothetical protein